MPAHVAGSVTVKVVSLGISGSGAYTYNPGPALLFPAPPGGEVNVAYSDQLTVTGGTSPYHLVGERRNPASRPDPRRVNRAAVRNADHRGQLLLHGQGHRP